MAAALHAYLNDARSAITTQNGKALRAVLQFSSMPADNRTQLIDSLSLPKSSSRFSELLPPDFAMVFQSHLTALFQLSRQQHKEAYQSQLSALKSFMVFMEDDKAPEDPFESPWWLPALYAIIIQLKDVAYQADASVSRLEHTLSEKACTEMMEIFRRFMRFNGKKMCLLFVIVLLFKIYFKIKNLRLCSNIINTVNAGSFPPLQYFPKSQVVTYKYYVGRLRLFEERFAEAEAALDEASRMCHRNATRNKRQILELLIPVKLVRGKLPQERTLRNYDLEQYRGLVAAIRAGNLRLFNESLEAHQSWFIKKGVFLMLEKLRTCVYRNLFKKVYLIQSKRTEQKSAQLQLASIQQAIALQGADLALDLDELECVIANLIYDGDIKGYIAHRRCVVLSKTDPFPRLPRKGGAAKA